MCARGGERVLAVARALGRYRRIALTIPLTIGAPAAILEGPVRDWAARDVATTQPIKLAAIEGLYKTTRGAPEHVLGVVWNENRTTLTGGRWIRRKRLPESTWFYRVLCSPARCRWWR